MELEYVKNMQYKSFITNAVNTPSRLYTHIIETNSQNNYTYASMCNVYYNEKKNAEGLLFKHTKSPMSYKFFCLHD